MQRRLGILYAAITLTSVIAIQPLRADPGRSAYLSNLVAINQYQAGQTQRAYQRRAVYGDAGSIIIAWKC